MGGQAVLEGVMMRGASKWAVAVRDRDGSIKVDVLGGAERPAFSSRRWKRSTRPPVSTSFCLPV